jgi:hypothetical protein
MPWFRRKSEPPSTESGLRDTLFGDRPLAAWTGDGTGEPWARFADAAERVARGDSHGAVAALASITARRGLESRHYLQAWNALRALGQSPPPADAKHLFGVVIEVTLPHGSDVLAVYDDHSARYLNARGGATIWDRPSAQLDTLIDQLLAAGRIVVARIGPWTGERPGPPPKNQARITLLTPSGPHFGEGPLPVLERDPLAGPVLAAGAALVNAFTHLVAAG